MKIFLKQIFECEAKFDRSILLKPAHLSSLFLRKTALKFLLGLRQRRNIKCYSISRMSANYILAPSKRQFPAISTARSK